MASTGYYGILLGFFLALQNEPIASVSSVLMEDFTVARRCVQPDCLNHPDKDIASKIMCACGCNVKGSCYGFLYVKSEKKCHYLSGTCLRDTSCVQSDVYIRTGCQNSGVLRSSGTSCQCINGWVGTMCERRPYNCEELDTYLYPVLEDHNVLLDIHENDSVLVNTTCRITNTSVLTYIAKSNGLVSHNRTWYEYEAGYYIDIKNIWLGLKHVFSLTQAKARSVVFVVYVTSFIGVEKYWFRMYDYFDLQDATTGYSFSVGQMWQGYVGPPSDSTTINLDDVLTLCQGYPFSTFDNNYGRNCGWRAGTGWWFPDCDVQLMNPLGWTGYVQSYGLTDQDKYIHIPNDCDKSNSNFWMSLPRVSMHFVSPRTTKP